MCLPKFVTRILIFVTSAISLAIGIYFIWFGAEHYDMEVFEESGDQSKIMAMLVLGIFLLLLAIGSIFAGMLDYKLVLPIYAGFLGAFAIWCLVSSIVIFERRDELDDTLDNRDDCRDDDFFKEADDEMYLASLVFCTLICPCKIDDVTKLDTLPPGKIYNGTATAVTECPCDEDI
jgi:hypothetical protein